MRVVLVGAEHQEDLAVRHLRSSLEASGHDVSHVAFNEAWDLDRAAERLAATGASLAGLSMVFTSRAAQFAHLAERARELGYRGHITVGGHFAAFNADALLRDVAAIDSVVIGEGELILCDLAARLDDLSAVPGLVFRTHDGCVVHNPPSPKLADLDMLPWPIRRHPYDDYLGLPLANMLGSRGCSHACSFCSISAWHRMCGGARLRLRSPERVAEEMAALWSDGVRIFNFHDDNFVLPNRRLMLERIERMRRRLEELGVGSIAFAMKARPDEIDRELLEPLVDMGLFRVFLGIEAGSDRSLLQLGRAQRLEHNERALALTGDLGLHACFNLLLWNPDTTMDDLILDVDWLRDHPHNPMNFSRTEVYAGTPLEQRLRESGRLAGDYWGYDYLIADPRAEEAFMIAHAAFEERNFGPTSLHHLAMRLDYEYHLYAHFFGDDAPTRRRVKAFVRRVNLDSYAHLSGILRAVLEGITDRPGFTATVAEQVHRGDRELGLLGQRLLRELEGAVAPARRTRSGPYARRAKAAVIAAALSVGAPACSDRRDQAAPQEAMAPSPSRSAPQLAARQSPTAPPAAQMAPLSPPLPADGPPAAQLIPGEPSSARVPSETQVPATPLGSPEAIRRQFNRRAMPHLVRAIRPARETTVELVIAADGRVTEASVHAGGLGAGAAGRIAGRLERLVFTGADVVGHRFELTVSASRLRAAATTRQVSVHSALPDLTHAREAAHRPSIDDRIRPQRQQPDPQP